MKRLWLFAAGLFFTQIRPSTRAQTVEPALKPLTFLSGTWMSEVPGDLEEEYWSAPLGSSMVGTFRIVHASGASAYEFWTIEVEAGKPVFKVRHFSHDLIGREEKSDPVRLDVSQPHPDSVSFSRPGADVSLLYERSGDNLTCTVTRQKDGKPDAHIFRYHRKP